MRTLRFNVKILILSLVVGLPLAIGIFLPINSYSAENQSFYDFQPVPYEDKCPYRDLPDGAGIDWGKDKALLDKSAFSNIKSCDTEFNILWHWAKKGVLEARYLLLFSMQYCYLPSTSVDDLTRQRYLYTLAVHSIGGGFTPDDNHTIDASYSNLTRLNEDADFTSCMKKGRSQDCSKIAVQRGYVPSFEAFSKEIDLLIAAGYKRICMPAGE